VALSWRSQLIEPVVVDNGPSVWVGVDQRVACTTREGTILFSLGLGSVLLNIKCFPEFVAILCDAELLTVNRDYSIRGVHHLDDVPDTIQVTNGQLVVTFIDGQTEIVE